MGSRKTDLGDAEVVKAISIYGGLEKYIEVHREVFNIDLETSERKIAKFIEQGIGITNILADDYPEILRQLKTPPTILYYYGDLSQLNVNRNIAIVGTRNSSAYGDNSARALVRSLTGSDACIVSGLAAGIDSASHGAALDSDMPTIAVLGSGLLKFHYGGVQRELFKRMQADPRNLIISEFAPDESARGWTYAHRNRLIAALSQATVVIEAPLGSGALITADHALKLGRKLYAIAADISKESFQGSNKLLAEAKAQPIYSYESFAEVLRLKSGLVNGERPTVNGEIINVNPVLAAMEFEPVSLDHLMNKLQLNQTKLFTELTMLELKGLVRKEAGGRYSKA
jgi:DNA processing protein